MKKLKRKTWNLFFRKSMLYFSFFVLNFLFLGQSLGFADGLSTSFVDVAVMDVPLGSPRSVLDKEGHGLVLENNGDHPVRVHVEVLIPTIEELRYSEPIPDTKWIDIIPRDLIIESHAKGYCEVKILIPRDRKFRNKKFQAMIWSRAKSVENRSVNLTVGLKSRLRIVTEK